MAEFGGRSMVISKILKGACAAVDIAAWVVGDSGDYSCASDLSGVVAETGARNSQLINRRAATAPISSAMTNPGRSSGRMPENVLVRERAMATAGLAKEVEAV